MLAIERQRAILDLVDEQGSVRVSELARQLQVTEETIRRDLEKLDHQGALRRIHGGALRAGAVRHDRAFEDRSRQNLAAKQAIARAAAAHIEEGDVIALDASSTAAALVPFLPEVELTVVTSSLVVINALLNRPGLRVVSTGGILDAPSLSFIGSLAEQALERFSIGKLFFSTKGLDPVRGLSVSEDGQARVKRRMVELAEVSYLLVDASKLGVHSTFFFAELADLDHVITDAGEKECAELVEGGVRVQRVSF